MMALLIICFAHRRKSFFQMSVGHSDMCLRSVYETFKRPINVKKGNSDRTEESVVCALRPVCVCVVCLLSSVSLWRVD